MYIRLRCFEKSPETQGHAPKRANRRRMADPRAPQQGSSAMWVGHGRALQTHRLGHPMAHPLGWAREPIFGPRQRVSAISFDVLRCLEGQTTSESYETRTVASVSKRASQRFKNHVHTTSVLREKPRNPRTRSQKSEPTTNGRPPSPPTGELGHVGRPWPSPADAQARPSHGPPPGMGTGAHFWSPTARFGDILRRFEVFRGSNDL